MGKSSHFIGQPMYSQVIKLLDKSRILQISRDKGGERYTKRFNGWIHLVVMLYAIIMRFDSLREITASLLTEARKLSHIGITFKIGRSTLADANKRRSEAIFESIYRDTYATYRLVISVYVYHTLLMDGDEVLSACNYNIQSLGDKKYLLKYEKDEKATIEVDGKTVVYNNPNVNIDGAKYQLQIKVK